MFWTWLFIVLSIVATILDISYVNHRIPFVLYLVVVIIGLFLNIRDTIIKVEMQNRRIKALEDILGLKENGKDSK